MVTALMPNRVRCDGKHTLPIEKPEIQYQVFSPLLCQKCNATSQGGVLTNDGDTLIIDLIYDDKNNIPILSNGPLKGKAFGQLLRISAVEAAITSGRVICAGKHFVPYYEDEVKFENKTFPPLLCENCDELIERTVVINNGKQVVFDVTYSDTKKIPTLRNGPLLGKGKYRLHGINFNWLYSAPDEWSWSNVSFPAELHITFYSLKYGNFEAAVNSNEGITILSMIFNVRKQAEKFVPSFKSVVPEIIHSRSNFNFPAEPPIKLSDFLPQTLDYFHTYMGTMAMHDTPWESKCKAKVIWIDVEDPLKIPPEDVLEYAKIRDFITFPQFPHIERYTGPKT
ncbi:carbonic anhydrase 3-like, partial [Musca vetustissima]|uniref:carbonic anhydrase 3-like n=1 Tax=Musca vetustissima TaxID=27455 RepID=UPI002AB781FE